jgi:hypothetical protein
MFKFLQTFVVIPVILVLLIFAGSGFGYSWTSPDSMIGFHNSSTYDKSIEVNGYVLLSARIADNVSDDQVWFHSYDLEDDSVANEQEIWTFTDTQMYGTKVVGGDNYTIVFCFREFTVDIKQADSDDGSGTWNTVYMAANWSGTADKTLDIAVYNDTLHIAYHKILSNVEYVGYRTYIPSTKTLSSETILATEGTYIPNYPGIAVGLDSSDTVIVDVVHGHEGSSNIFAYRKVGTSSFSSAETLSTDAADKIQIINDGKDVRCYWIDSSGDIIVDDKSVNSSSWGTDATFKDKANAIIDFQVENYQNGPASFIYNTSSVAWYDQDRGSEESVTVDTLNSLLLDVGTAGFVALAARYDSSDYYIKRKILDNPPKNPEISLTLNVISWSSVDSDVDDYQIYDDTVLLGTVDDDTLSYTLPTGYGASSTLKVRALDLGENLSDFSDTVSFTPPDAPTNVNLTIPGSSAYITWTKQEAVKHYVRRSIPDIYGEGFANAAYVGSTNGTSKSDSHADVATYKDTYDIKYYVYCLVDGVYSDVELGSEMINKAPGVPGTPSIDNSGSTPIISWTAPTVNEYDIVSYSIQRLIDGVPTGTNLTSTDLYVDDVWTDAETDDEPMSYKVRAYDGSLYGNYSAASAEVDMDYTLNKRGLAVDFNDENSIPTEYYVGDAYPNPFNPTTQIGFGLPDVSNVDIEIYNVTGQKVATLASGVLNAGIHSVKFDAKSYPSGTYFFRVVATSNGEVQLNRTGKLLLIK